MNIGILGLGSLGSLMAYHWRNHALFALPRTDISSVNIKVQDQDTLWQTQLPSWQGEPLEWLVVCTKAADTLAALNKWKHLLTQANNILLLQNGMGQQQETAQWLQQQQINTPLWAAMCTEGAYRENDTVIYAGRGSTQIGSWLGSEYLPPQLPKTQYSENIKELLLNKLAINAVINPLTAYWECKNGELVNNPQYKQALIALSEEVAGLYATLSWPLSQPLTELAQQVAIATAANTSSSLQDKLANRPTELPYICGYLLEQAQRIAYDLPLTQFYYHHLSA